MDFIVNSAYFHELHEGGPCKWLDPTDCYSLGLDKYLEILRPYTYIKEGNLFMSVDSLEQLNFILLDLRAKFNSIELDNNCWAPDEVIIDFINKQITFRDYYIE